jgi:hypothetical protein
MTVCAPASAANRASTATAEAAACSADVIARSNGGSLLARQSVTASGYQSVSLGTLPADGWHLEIAPSCDVTVSVLFGVTAPAVSRRRASGHR